MSNSSPVADSGRISGQKMNFSATCNLLSQYIKDKRSISLSSGGLAAASDGYGNNKSTMNLFPITGKPTSGVGDDSSRCIGHIVNLFPKFSPSDVPIDSLGKRGSPEPESGQMTIFYGGQVLVFNNLPVDKAKEVMALASNFESSLKKSKVEPPTSSIPKLNVNPGANLNPNPNVTPNINVMTNFASPHIPSAAPQFRGPVGNASDLPIARKASLHRFLEKRKDRLIGNAPSSPDLPNGSSSKGVDGKTWLGLGSLPVYKQPLQQL